MIIIRNQAKAFPRYICLRDRLPEGMLFEVKTYREIQSGDPVEVDDAIGEILCDRKWTILSIDPADVKIEYSKPQDEED